MVAIDSAAFMIKCFRPKKSSNMITIIVNDELLHKIREHYHPFIVMDNSDYVLFRAKKNKVTITAYQNTKGKDVKITFVGQGFESEVQKWDSSLINLNIHLFDDEPLGWVDTDDQIGSDEVGTGDYLGPICVCAALVRKKDVPYLRKIGVADSKKLTDDFIMKVTPTLLKKFSYSQVSLSNEKYNELTLKGININEMKSRLHNRVLLNLIKKHGDIRNVYVDKFVSESRYFTYASRDKEIVKNIIFKTKGESRFPSVALASMIARYSFLKKMEVLRKKYDVAIPFGASHKVDAFAISFNNKHGINEFKKIAKLNFENSKRVYEHREE